MRLIEERADGLTDAQRAELLHCVAAHHDARAARTAEAAVLYHANQLDASAATRPDRVNGLLLALGASLAWGVADFVGPWQGRALGALRVLLWAQIAGVAAVAIVVARPRRGAARRGGAARGPGRDLGDARPLRLLPRHGDRRDGRRGADRGRLRDRPGRLRDPDGRPALTGRSTRGSPARSSASCSPRRSTRRAAQRRVAAGVGLALLAAVGFGFYFPPMHAAGKADPFWASLIFRMSSTADRRSSRSSLAGRALRLGGWKLADRRSASASATRSGTSSSPQRRRRAGSSASPRCSPRSTRS